MRERELIVYGGLEQEEILKDMVTLMEEETAVDGRERGCRILRGLLEMAGDYGYGGNLWHCYLTHLLVNNENSYSTESEIRGAIDGSINEAVLQDISLFRDFFQFDFLTRAKQAGISGFELIADYHPGRVESRIYNRRIRDRICSLARLLADAPSVTEMKERLTDFYRDYGVGKLGLHKAFRIEERNGGWEIVPISKIAHVHLDDLIGYEIAKKKLVDNTEAFVYGRKANNCLLFGDSGTGKSSSIKAITNRYYEDGLRIIEVYKHQFRGLGDIIAQIKNRNYRFIIYMDDLSFEEFETDYKYLKAVIEGGLEKKPDNVLIYATSNRRHLVREKFSDKEERQDDLHSSDTVQEKLSLAARFGVTIYFGSPDKKEFETIVLELAKRQNLKMDTKLLLSEANKWELSHSGLSGRSAKQFIDYLCGMEGTGKGEEDEAEAVCSN